MLQICTELLKGGSTKLYRRYPTLHCCVCFVLMLLLLPSALSFTPYIGKSLVYPLIFHSQEMKGTIKDTTWHTERLGGRSHSTVYIYTFWMDGFHMQVFPSDYREYEVGEEYPYVRYSLFDVEINECVEYRLLWGITGVLVIGILTYVTVIFCFMTNRYEESKASLQKLPELPEYEQMTDKELYVLCQAYGIRVDAKRKKEREHLRQCLRNYAKKAQEHNRKVRERSQKRKWDKMDFIIMGIPAAIILAMMVDNICDTYYRWYQYF